MSTNGNSKVMSTNHTKKKKMASNTMAKLLNGCHELMHGAAGSFRRLPKDKFERLDSTLLESIGFWLKMYQSLTYMYLSINSYTNQKFGESVALRRKQEYYSNDIAPLEGSLK